MRTSIFLSLCLFVLFVYSEEREDPGGTLNKRVSFREKLSASMKSAKRICCNWGRRNRSVERRPSSSSSEAPSQASPQIPEHTSLRAPQSPPPKPSLPQSSSPRLSPPQLSLPQPSPRRSSQMRLSPPSPPPWQRRLPSPTRSSPPRRRQEPSRSRESPPSQQSPCPTIIRNYSPEPLPPRQPTFQPLQSQPVQPSSPRKLSVPQLVTIAPTMPTTANRVQFQELTDLDVRRTWLGLLDGTGRPVILLEQPVVDGKTGNVRFVIDTHRGEGILDEPFFNGSPCIAGAEGCTRNLKQARRFVFKIEDGDRDRWNNASSVLPAARTTLPFWPGGDQKTQITSDWTRKRIWTWLRLDDGRERPVTVQEEVYTYPEPHLKICCDEKKNVVLDCGHRICTSCHERIHKGQPGLGRVGCPMCGDRFRSQVQFGEELHLKGRL